MARDVAEILLWLFVMNLGITFGAGLYESRIIVAQWAGSLPESLYRWNTEAARRPHPGLRFWVFVTTVPLTLLTLANLVAAWQAQGASRGWWLGAAVAVVVERMMTFSYFIPTMIKLERAVDFPDSQVVTMALQWAHLNHVRSAITLTAWVAALKAFSLLYQPGG